MKYVISQEAENRGKRKRKLNAFGTTRRYITTHFSNGELLKNVLSFRSLFSFHKSICMEKVLKFRRTKYFKIASNKYADWSHFRQTEGQRIIFIWQLGFWRRHLDGLHSDFIAFSKIRGGYPWHIEPRCIYGRYDQDDQSHPTVADDDGHDAVSTL